METHAPGQPVDVDKSQPIERGRFARGLLLAIATVWFLIQALPLSFDGDATLALMGLVQRLALGFALVAAALIDWRGFHGLFGIE